jgi:hypothetical protein
VKLEPGNSLGVTAMIAILLEHHDVATVSQTLEIKKHVKLIKQLTVHIVDEYVTLFIEPLDGIDILASHIQYRPVPFKSMSLRTKRSHPSTHR